MRLPHLPVHVLWEGKHKPQVVREMKFKEKKEEEIKDHGCIVKGRSHTSSCTAQQTIEDLNTLTKEVVEKSISYGHAKKESMLIRERNLLTKDHEFPIIIAKV